jgi:myosin heavy subunit
MGDPAPAVWGVPDVTQLIELSEQTVVANLRERFEHGEIHTFTGASRAPCSLP